MATHTNKRASAPVARGNGKNTSDEWGPAIGGGGGEKHDFGEGPLVGTLVSAEITDTVHGPRLIVVVQTSDGQRDHFMSEGWAAKFDGYTGQKMKLSSNGLDGTKRRYSLQWAAAAKRGARTMTLGATKDETGDDIPF